MSESFHKIRRWDLSLDIELPVASSSHDFLQVHIDLLSVLTVRARVWLVFTFKTTTAEIAARNFVSSVFRDVGLSGVLVLDRDTRFTRACWFSLHEALGASLIFGSSHHHNTTSKVARVNCFIANVLLSFSAYRGDDWPDFVPLAEFAINDSASALGSGYTQFYADSCQHPRRPLNPPASPDPATPACSGEATAHPSLMGLVTAEARALLQARPDQRKAGMDAHGLDVQLAVGDEVLLDTEHKQLPSRPLLSPLWTPGWAAPSRYLHARRPTRIASRFLRICCDVARLR